MGPPWNSWLQRVHCRAAWNGLHRTPWCMRFLCARSSGGVAVWAEARRDYPSILPCSRSSNSRPVRQGSAVNDASRSPATFASGPAVDAPAFASAWDAQSVAFLRLSMPGQSGAHRSAAGSSTSTPRADRREAASHPQARGARSRIPQIESAIAGISQFFPAGTLAAPSRFRDRRPLLCLNPGNNAIDNLVYPKSGCIEHVHAPSRVATLPACPAFPSHRVDLRAAYHFLVPLRVDGVHTLPRRPRQHIMCRSARSPPSKSI
jgi:hypothetical protein